jgi:hypothetical protein
MVLKFLDLIGIYNDIPENFAKVFKKCQEELLIATDLDPEFFENHIVLDTIMKLAKRGTTIKMIYTSEVNLKRAPVIKEMIDKGYISSKLGDGLDDYFIVGDGWHYRAHGYINRKSFEMARILTAKFDRMWNSLSHGSNLYQGTND